MADNDAGWVDVQQDQGWRDVEAQPDIAQKSKAAAMAAGVQNPGISVPPLKSAMEAAGARHEANEERLGAAMDRASRSPTPFSNAASVLYPAAELPQALASGGLKAVAKTIGRGVAKTAAGTGIGSGVGAGVGSMVGHPKEGAEIGATVGGLTAPFAPDAWFSRAPYGLNRVILGEEGLANARSASKLAQRNADIAAGLRAAPAAPPATPEGAPLPSSDEFYEQRAADLMRRGKEQEALDRAAARTAKANAPKIVSPNAAAPRSTGSEGRPATWTNERVNQLMRAGNRDAIAQGIRRGMELPENARYVMGDADYPRAVLNPRETTLFTPEGTPIRNSENAIAQNPSSKARIATTEMPPAKVEPRPTPEEEFKREMFQSLSKPQSTAGTGPLEPSQMTQLTDKLAEIKESHGAEGVDQDDLDHLNELADEFEGKPQANQNDIRAQISKARSRYNQYSDKMANARNPQTANRYMRQMQALEQKATRLERALKTGEGVRPELKGATKAELNSTYNQAHPDVRAAADYLADLYSKSEYGAKTDFEQHYGLKSGATKGLPIKERLARFLSNHPEEVEEYVREFGSSKATPQAGRSARSGEGH